MIPKTDKDSIELFVIQPHYKRVVDMKKVKGKTVRIPREVFVKENWLRVWMSKEDIKIRGQYTNKNGEILKSRSTIFNRVTGSYYSVAHSLDEINNALYDFHKTEVGFKKYNNEI